MFLKDYLVLAARGLRELFFPRKCVVCGKYLSMEEEDICLACLEDLPLTYQWSIVQNAAFERLARRFEVEAAAALFFFGSESDYRKILYGIKYGGRRQLGRRMGALLGEQLANNAEFRRCQAVVPVPLHPLRRCPGKGRSRADPEADQPRRGQVLLHPLPGGSF